MDVVHAVRRVCPGQVGHIVTTLSQTLQTGFGRDKLTSRVMLLLSQWQDLAKFMQDRIVHGHFANMSASEILSEVTNLTEHLGTVPSVSDRTASPF